MRLPKDVAFPEDVKQVTVVREGKKRIVVPADSLWDDFFDAAGVNLGERSQPPAEVREEF